MKVGVLGSGSVAQTLAAGFIKHGHQAMIGTRDSAKLAEWLSKNPKAKVGSFSDAAAFGEVVVLAVKGLGRGRRFARCGNCESGREAGDGCLQSHCGCAAGERSFEVFHYTRRLADGAAAARISHGALCEGVQLGGRTADGESRSTKLASRRCLFAATTTAQRPWRRRFSTSLAGRRRTWARWKRRAPLSRCACCGASLDSRRTSGRTLSSSCANNAGTFPGVALRRDQTQPFNRIHRILRRSMATEKTFYLETFGCQMNAHDSEKVIGTLAAAGLPAGRVGRRRRPDPLQHLLHPRQGGAEGLQSPERLQEAAQGRQALRRAGLRGAAGGREDLRARAVRFAGLGLGLLPQTAGDADAAGSGRKPHHRPRRPPDRRDLRDRVHRAPESLPRLHHHHRGLRQVLLLLRGAVHARQGAQPDFVVGARQKRGASPIWATPRFNCWART